MHPLVARAPPTHPTTPLAQTSPLAAPVPVAAPNVTRASPSETELPARRRWHAKLSALQAARGARAGTAALAASRRSLAGSSLDPAYLGVPLTWKAPDAGGLLAVSGQGVRLDAPGDDGGRQLWELREVPGAPGEYNVVEYSGGSGEPCSLLGAAGPVGRDVVLWSGDDGSGLQRWVLSHIGGDARFELALAGGKADAKVFLGADAHGVRLYSRRSARTSWDAGIVPYCEDIEPEEPTIDVGDASADDVDSAPELDESSSRNTHVPRSVINTLTWLSERQVDMIMQLVSLPENGNPKWYTHYDYIEFLGDGRGFTTTIFGACSGTGDLYLVLQELDKIQGRSDACDRLLDYKDKLRKKRGDDIDGIEGMKPLIRSLGDDPSWHDAVWRAFLKLYWTFALEWAQKEGAASGRPGPRITSVAGRGFILDTAINHGADMDSFKPIVQRMRHKDTKDELAWLEDFAQARLDLLRSGYQQLDSSGTGDRCRLWLPLFRDNPNLAPPIKAYRGYWGKFTLT